MTSGEERTLTVAEFLEVVGKRELRVTGGRWMLAGGIPFDEDEAIKARTAIERVTPSGPVFSVTRFEFHDLFQAELREEVEPMTKRPVGEWRTITAKEAAAMIAGKDVVARGDHMVDMPIRGRSISFLGSEVVWVRQWVERMTAADPEYIITSLGFPHGGSVRYAEEVRP